MSATFRATAKAVIHVNGGVLLIRKPNGMWDLPGGRMDAGEEPWQALAREVAEETGLELKIGDLVHAAVRDKAEPPNVLFLAYRCTTADSLDNVALSHEHEEAKVFGAAAAAGLDMDPVYKEAVRLSFEGF